MRRESLLVLLVSVSSSAAADLTRLPPNTWVKLNYTTEQPADPAAKGHFARQGWNKLVYDPDGKRVLFYDRWIDKKHGGYTIYGNCRFSFDPAAGRLTPVKIDNWTKKDTKQGGYRTLALPENDQEPTPCPRHVYHAFEYGWCPFIIEQRGGSATPPTTKHGPLSRRPSPGSASHSPPCHRPAGLVAPASRSTN